jgi:hypothetical protein
MKSGFKESGERAGQFRRLTFQDNFESAEVEIEISAGVEITVTNPFRNSGRIPSKWIIVNDRGIGILKRGTAEWTVNTLSFLNASSADSVDATVLLLR